MRVMEEKGMKKKTLGMIAGLLSVFLCGCAANDTAEEKEAISVYLWSANLMLEYAPYIQSQLPDVEIEFVVGNNDLDFYAFLKENGALPDIITNRRFSLYDATQLKGQLLDLSGTQEAGTIYLSYLENYTNNDGTINWLPLCGEVDGFIANKALFEQYGIALPTDYTSFVAACQAFEKEGIRGFVADFAYDYTCMEILQGLSIPELTSMDGLYWRHRYEDPSDELICLDEKIWPGVFERMEQFIGDAGIMAEDITLGYDPVRKMFSEGKVAITRGTGTQVIWYAAVDGIDPVFLPYFGQNGKEWLLTYPSFHVALNKDLEKDEKRREQAFQILNVMLSEEGQNILADQKDVLPYSRDVKLELSDELASLQPYIEENHLYVRMASNDFFAISKDVVQKMILGEYDARQAYEAFDGQLRNPKDDAEQSIVHFEQGYSNTFHSNSGNASASVMANTLREHYGSDVLIAPAYSFTGSVMNAEYTEQMVSYMIMPNALEAWQREMTGAELKRYLKVSVEGTGSTGSGFAPFNRSSLPTVSGISIEVSEQNGKYTLNQVLSDGKEISDTAVYRVTCLNSKRYLQNLTSYLYPEEDIAVFQKEDVSVRGEWTDYIKNGGHLAEPSDYITLR